jgi:hypothetical protein
MGALEFGRDPQCRQQEPQVGGSRGLQQELAIASSVRSNPLRAAFIMEFRLLAADL